MYFPSYLYCILFKATILSLLPSFCSGLTPGPTAAWLPLSTDIRLIAIGLWAVVIGPLSFVGKMLCCDWTGRVWAVREPWLLLLLPLKVLLHHQLQLCTQHRTHSTAPHSGHRLSAQACSVWNSVRPLNLIQMYDINRSTLNGRLWNGKWMTYEMYPCYASQTKKQKNQYLGIESIYLNF